MSSIYIDTDVVSYVGVGGGSTVLIVFDVTIGNIKIGGDILPGNTALFVLLLLIWTEDAPVVVNLIRNMSVVCSLGIVSAHESFKTMMDVDLGGTTLLLSFLFLILILLEDIFVAVD